MRIRCRRAFLKEFAKVLICLGNLQSVSVIKFVKGFVEECICLRLNIFPIIYRHHVVHKVCVRCSVKNHVV